MKRMLALLLVLFILPISASALTVSGPGEFPIVDEPVELTVMACVNVTVESWKENARMLEYEKETGVKINWIEVVDADIQETIRRALISGETPDIVLWWFADTAMLQTFGSAGTILPLNDLIENYTVNAKAQLEADPKLKAFMTSQDGNIYTLWNVQSNENEMIWNKQFLFMPWFEKYSEATGAQLPETLDEYRAMLEYFRDNDMNGNGDKSDEIPLVLEMGATGERCLHQLLNAFGIKASNDAQFCVLDDGTYTLVYEHPRYREFLTEVQQLYADGIIDPEFVTRYLAEVYPTMSGNLAGSEFIWAEQQAVHTETLNASGDEDALYLSCAPITGPYGDQWIQMRQGLTPNWCITVKAEQEGKVENILKFWNWQFSEEGRRLYNYGLEGYTYDIVDGVEVLRYDVVKNGFNDYRTLGMEYEPFGGDWQNNAFMQCVFSGKTVDDLTIPRKSFYDGLNENGVNAGHYYAMPPTLETDAYVEYHGELMTGGNGVCTLRDQCIAGQLTVDEFFAKYEALKDRGLQDVIDEGNEAYQLIK